MALALLGASTTPAGATATASVMVPSSSPALANFPSQAVVDPAGYLWVVSNNQPSTYLTRVAPDGTAVVAWDALAVALPNPSACTDSRNYGVASAAGRIYWSCDTAAVYSISATASLPVGTADITLEVDLTATTFKVNGVVVASNGDIIMNNWDRRMFVRRAGDAPTAATEITTGVTDGWIWPMAPGPDGNVYVLFDGDPAQSKHDVIFKVDVVGGTYALTPYWTDPVANSSANGVGFLPGTSTMIIADFDSTIGIRAILDNGDGTGSLAGSTLFSGDPLIERVTGMGIAASGDLYVVVSDSQSIHAITKVVGITYPVSPTTTSTAPSSTTSTTSVATSSTTAVDRVVIPAFAG